MEVACTDNADPVLMRIRPVRCSDGTHKSAPAVEIGAAETIELQKVGKLGWEGKLVIGWALSEDMLAGFELVCTNGHRKQK